jgi:L-ascorbate metabolism protein UlaG (beta-lactamase superfamily)
MKYFTLIFLLFISNFVEAQENSYSFKTESGSEITIYPIYHGSLVIEFQEERIVVDPFGGAQRYEQFDDFDTVIITDIHGDHFNPSTLEGLNIENAQIIAPQAVIERNKDAALVSKMKRMDNGGNRDMGKWQISAIPMYNLPDDSSSRHAKGRGNGYILNFEDKTIYISGDTEDIVEMRNLKEVDLAFVCMNLPYTMDINQASSAVLEFLPKRVIPYHYRGSEMSNIEAFKELVNSKSDAVEVILMDWYN